MEEKIAVIGLGYVGLPLAVAFGRRFKTIGFDVSAERIASCKDGRDHNGEVSSEELRAAAQLTFSNDPQSLVDATFIVVAVPTPVDDAHQPDFTPLRRACEIVGPRLRDGDLVVFESTVYPGATEEVCVPILERLSGLQWKTEFFVGYSPERINPGDRAHRLETITKVVSGDCDASEKRVVDAYRAIVSAGVHLAPNIKTAEAAKVIENTQRDLNISLMNELAIIFHRLGIDTGDVLAAARTKWNFLPFAPGLVGGHCIGVDPYYLTYQAEKNGHHPQVILAGRRINDGMGRYVAQQTVKEMVSAGIAVQGARVTVLGLTFKENCPDLRNTKVVDLIHELKSFGAQVTVHDAMADAREAKAEYGLALTGWEELSPADALVLAVAHREYVQRPVDSLLEKVRPGGCVIDVKSALAPSDVRGRGLRLWRL